MSNLFLDLTDDSEPVNHKRAFNSSERASSSSSSAPKVAKVAKATKVNKKNQPHVLLWICSHGKGQGRTWKQDKLKVLGVFPSKEAAENKKSDVMSQHDCCGHGDILVGGCWDDEIDLVIRPTELFL